MAFMAYFCIQILLVFDLVNFIDP